MLFNLKFEGIYYYDHVDMNKMNVAYRNQFLYSFNLRNIVVLTCFSEVYYCSNKEL